MTRPWTALVAEVAGFFGLPLLILLMFATATVVATLWYWFPAWVPRRVPTPSGLRWRWPRWRLRWPHWRWSRPRLAWRPRWPVWRGTLAALLSSLLSWLLSWLPWRRRRGPEPAAEPPLVEPEAGDELPDVPADDLSSRADRLAAEGRYAEAVRERLRAIVRELVDRGVLDHRPGWTVTELARAAAAARPTVDAPLTEAGRLFSDIWYGSRPAHAGHDARMRELVADVHRALVPVGASS